MTDNSSPPLVSIIIPTYKRPHMLHRAGESALNQTYSNIEVIIVDDNAEGSSSRIDTENVMRRFSSDTRVQYIRHRTNQGGSMARNTGIAAAQGVFIAFLDDDDEFYPEKIEKQYRCFAKSDVDRLGIVFCGANWVDEKGKLLRHVLNRVRGDAFAYHMTRNLSTCQTLFIPTSVVREVHGFRLLRCAQDYDLVLRILAAGYRVDYVNETLVTVHIHAEERISTNDNKIAGKMEMYSLKSKYFDRLSPKIIRRVNYAYHILLFRHYRMRHQYGTAVRHYFSALAIHPFDPRNFTEGMALFLPYFMLVRIKTFFHRLNTSDEDIIE
jgi:glycosyltransferase involved in cell wall biosynthesis